MFDNLHNEIRVKNGAYGGGARMASLEGIFSFYSYRDPYVDETLEAFERAIGHVSDGGFSEEELERAKLAVFGKVDAPIAPGERGLNYFLNHVTDAMRQKYERKREVGGKNRKNGSSIG